ncbi:MAG: hypothetical protein IPH13_13680 [Planctomycetes bacterium]|nr:hypothetical protein [Planctomycetota bacterium]MCC7171807.1 hypothetical protein [Planctomycetota bacterium]
MHASNDSQRHVRVALALLLATAPWGCGDEPSDRTIPTVSTQPARPVALDATSAERFGYRAQPGPDGSSPFAYTTPPGFELIAPTPLRIVNFKVDGDSGVECYLSPVESNDVAANVNRWRKQMGADALDAAGIEALPRRSLIGKPGTLVELTGTYAAMGSEPKSDYGLIGVFAALPMAGISLKMIGPQAAVLAARERFLALNDSLRLAGESAANAGASTAASMPEATDVPAQDALKWTLPPGWSESPREGMRLMTFTMATSPNCECWLIGLGGDGGGAAANLNRWQRELGQEPLAQAAIDALPRMPILNRDSRTIEIHGRYQGMSGPAIDDAMMLGAICELGPWTLFVKMVGPKAEMETQRTAFQAFCASLR